MPASVELKNTKKSYGSTEIIKGVDLKIEPSEFVVLVGPSGCGKSTLLRMIAGLEDITSGDIFFDDQRVNSLKPAERRVGMVFQSYALYPHMTVEQNIGFGLKLAKKTKEERTERVEDALKILQLDQLRDRKPSALSGGQRQRVAIGRAIVRRPNVFLFDEPLSNLDTALRVQMRMEIGQLHRRLMNTVVYVTHDQVEAMTLADRIVVLEGGEVRQSGKPMELYEHPENMFVAGFMGSPKMGFLSGKVLDHSEAGVTVGIERPGTDALRLTLPNNGSSIETGAAVTLGVRPEHMSVVGADTAGLKGEVLELERLGSDTYAFVSLPRAEEPVAVRLASSHAVKSGDIINILPQSDKAHLFDGEGKACLRRQL